MPRKQQNTHITDTKLFKLIKRVDVFSKPIQLQFDQKEDYHTYCGASLTIMFGIVCGIYFIIQLYNYFILKNPSVVFGQQVLGDRSIYLGDGNFTIMFALRSFGKYNFLDPTVYNVQAVHKIKETVILQNGTIIASSSVKNLTLQSCDPSLSILQSTFIQQEITTYLCVNLSQGLQLKGQFQDPTFEYISIYVNKCINGTTNITCSNPKVIEKKLEGSIFQLYFTNTLLDFAQTKGDIFQDILGEAHATYAVGGSRETNIFLEPITVQTSVFDLLPSTKRENVQFIKSTELADINDKGQIFQAVFRFADTQLVYNLHNENIFFLFSQLGGLWNFLVILGSLCIKPFREFSRKLSIINRIFLFEPEEIEQAPQQTDTPSYPKLRITAIQYLTYFLPYHRCQKRINLKKLNQIEYASQQIWDKLDIIYLLKKLNQLERLMTLALPKEQQKQFLELQKRVIPLDAQPQSSVERQVKHRIRKSKLNSIIPMDDEGQIYERRTQRGVRTMVDPFDAYRSSDLNLSSDELEMHRKWLDTLKSSSDAINIELTNVGQQNQDIHQSTIN